MRKRQERKRAQQAAPVVATPARLEVSFKTGSLLLLALALALYWSGLRHPLVFDDLHLAEHSLKTVYSQRAGQLGMRWLSDASFWWVYAAFGKDLLWQRLANLLLHAGTAIVLFAFLARLFGQFMPAGRSRWLAFAGAALFVLHPVAVYGAGYLIQRSIVMSTLGSLAALYCVLEFLLSRNARWAWAALAAYLLAMSSKEHAVMLPAVALALCVLLRAPLRQSALPLGLLALVSVGAVLRMKGYLGTAYEPFAGDVISPQAPVSDPYLLSVINQAALFFRYLGTWLVPWPGWMSADLRTAFPRELASWQTAGFAAWLGYGAAAAWLLTRGGLRGLAGFGLLYPWLFALTEEATVRAQEPFVLYRSYLWMSGLPVLLALVRVPPRILAGVLVAVGVLFSAAAYERLQTFSSSFRLWDDAAGKNDPALPLAERAYLSRGLLHLDAARLEEAEADFARAMKLNPAWPDAWLARATLRLRRDRMAEAKADLDRAIELDPKYASAYDKRCLVVTRLEGPAKGLPDCEKALSIDHNNHEAWINAGAIYHALQRPAEAAKSFERALAISPSDPSANYNYGVLLLDMGRRDLAVRNHIEIGCGGGIPQACDILKRSRMAP